MVRIKRGKITHKKRERLLKQVKGYRWKRKSKYRLAIDAFRHALSHAYKARREKKRRWRRLWNIRISAALKGFGLSFSKFINLLKKNNIQLNRRVLVEILEKDPEVFAKIVKEILEKS